MAERSPITVRSVRIEDAEESALILDQPRACWGTLQRPFVSREQRRAGLQKMLEDPNLHFLGAEIDSRLVGTLGLHVSSNPRCRHVASIGMAVHDEFAGRGVGSALMAAALDLCDNWLNVFRVELDVYVDNEPALALYRKFGFQLEGTQRAVAMRDGRYVDSYMMARLREVPSISTEG